VLADSADGSPDPSNVDLVLLASSKLVHDLIDQRAKREDDAVAVLAVEQLYPAPAQELAKLLRQYPKATVRWVQNEPKNQGAWPYMALNLSEQLSRHGESRSIGIISRPAAASPATGSAKVHAAEQEDLFAAAFDR
jgi:2-oxoglutarate dehydrogenase E1 component